MEDIAEIRKHDRLTERLARCFRDLRHQAGWSLDDLTDRCGVSRATLSRLEHGDVSPTAHALARIARAYDMPAARLMRLAEADAPQVLTRDAQDLSTDATTGAEERQVSPAAEGYGTAVTEGHLPRTVSREVAAAGGREAHLVVTEGRLTAVFDEATFDMRKGDSLRLFLDHALVLTGVGKSGGRYLLFTA